MWKTDRRDFFVAFATCIVISFASITYGLLAGVVLQWLSSFTRGYPLRSKVSALELVEGHEEPLSDASLSNNGDLTRKQLPAVWRPFKLHAASVSESAPNSVVIVGASALQADAKGPTVASGSMTAASGPPLTAPLISAGGVLQIALLSPSFSVSAVPTSSSRKPSACTRT